MQQSRFWFPLLITAMAALLLSACPPAAPAVVEPEPIVEPPDEPRVVRMAIGADEGMLTPYTYVFGDPGYYLMKLIYDSLLELDADNIPQLWLAEEMEISADGATYTFTLREGILWHDGEPFTASDVQFTYEYFVEYPFASRFLRSARQVAEIQTPDERTVIMTLERPNPGFVVQALADVPILPQHIWGEVDDPENFDGRVGTGPFTLVEFVPEQFYRLDANPDYFMGRPTIDQLVLPIIVDITVMFSALRADEVDTASRPLPAELVPEFEAQPDISLVSGPGFVTRLLQFNNERPPLDQEAVRRAIALAIDLEELVDVILLGMGTVGSPGFVHPSSPFANPEVQPTYDPELANSLLDEAGFVVNEATGIRETPNGEPLSFQLLAYSTDPERIRSAEMIRDWVRDIGIQVEIQVLDPGTVDALVWPDFDVAAGRDFDMAMWGWSAPIQIDPGRIVDLFHSDTAVGSLNIGAYQSESFDVLAEELAETMDMDERMQLIQAMQAVVAEEMPFVTLYYGDRVFAYRPAAYDQYVFVSGAGIVSKLSFIER